jgi:hypothetical protein
MITKGSIMATANITNKPRDTLLDFDELSAKLAMLSANLHLLNGEHGIRAFDELSDEIKENYLWGCVTLADECRAIMSKSIGGE